MASFANITVNNHAGTATLFEARYNVGPEQQWRYPATADVIVGDHTISLTSKINRAKPDETHKIELEIVVPLVDAPAAAGGYTPAPKQIGRTRFLLVGFLPGRGTTSQRQNAVAYLKNVLSNAQITDAFVNLAPPA